VQPAARVKFRFSAAGLLWLALAVVVIAIAIAPLLYTVNAAFYREIRTGLSDERSLVAIINVFASAEYLGFLWNALFLATVVTIASVSVGVALALVLGRTDLPGKSVFDLLVIMPMFLSPFTGMIAWIALGSVKTGFINGTLIAVAKWFGFEMQPLVNIWSYTGVVWVMFLFFTSLVYLFTVSSLRSMDTSLEESARTNGATAMQTLLRITLPMQLPAILSSALLVFILAAEMYTIPGLIGSTVGFTTLPWRIYQDSTAFPVRQAHAAAAGTMLLMFAIFGVWLQRRITRLSSRYVTISGKGFRSNPLKLGKWKVLAFALVLGYVLCADILPISGLLISSLMKYSAPAITLEIFTLEHYKQIFTLQNILDALWNTTWLAVLSGVACVLMGFMISHMDVRRPGRATKLLAFLGVLPVAVPGLVYGIGLLWIYIQTPLYGTAWVLLFAYIAKFLPYGIMTSRSGILQLHPEMEESARMSGASSLRTLQFVTMPLMKTTLIAILVFVMLQSIKELSASVLLYTQKSQVLSVLTWHYMDAGNYQFAAAIGVVQTVMMMMLVVMTRAVFRVKLEKTVGG
jgi:iron(III) transport system permease protein